MATETPISRGNALLAAGDHEAAAKAFTEALKAEPSADLHEALARAHIKGEAYLEAAEAALRAVTLDPQLAKGYLRRGIALFHLDEFESAMEAFKKGKELRPTLAAFDTWIRKCTAEIEGEVEEIKPASPPRGPPKITIIPPPKAATATAKPAATAAASSKAGAGSSGPSTSAPAAAASKQQHLDAPLPPMIGVPVPNKIRHQWYQVGSKVVIDVFAKGLPAERFSAQFSETHLRLEVLRDTSATPATATGGASSANGQDAAAAAGGEGSGPEWELDVELFGAVDPAACRYEVLRTKVEVTLVKADAARAWATLEKSGAAGLATPAIGVAAAPSSSSAAAATAPEAAAAAAPAAGPPRVYPSSKGPKDWSAVEREVQELEAKGELDEGDPLNNFFKKIFSQGDEDTRRAMMKSFVESNGTVLSTNWSEVGAKKVECTPPDGMEVKKWGQE